MSRYDYNYSCTGCGSGSSCTYEILIDGVHNFGGSLQVGCSADQAASNLAAIVAKRPYGALDVAYANGVLISGTPPPPPGPGSTETDYLLIVAVLVLGYLLWRKL